MPRIELNEDDLNRKTTNIFQTFFKKDDEEEEESDEETKGDEVKAETNKLDVVLKSISELRETISLQGKPIRGDDIIFSLL